MRFNTGDPDAVRRWNYGISVYDDLDRAIALASDGGFEGVAMLTVTEPTANTVVTNTTTLSSAIRWN
jgi:hypothetical protein